MKKYFYAQTTKMKLVSWNVNGIRASMKKGFADVLAQFDADIFCVQETKAQDDQVAEAVKEITGYQVFSNSAEKKGYSGNAIFSKTEPISITNDIGIEEHDNEGRVICAEYDNFNFITVYVPNSGGGLKRLDYRAEWDKAFADYLAKKQEHKPLILTGDFNVAHKDIDLANPKSNYDKTAGFTQKEIDGFDNILSIGLTDTFRQLNAEKVQYTFWNQRFNARARNAGWRIDYFLVSNTIAPKVTGANIHDQVMGSDHCPVELIIDL